MIRPPAVGSGYNPSAWCGNCGDPYPVEGICSCVLEETTRARIAQFIHDLIDAASIRSNTLALLRELYGPKCSDCGQPAESAICGPCMERRLR